MNPYLRKTTFYQNASGSRNILTTDTSTITLQSINKAAVDTIYLQKLHVEITTPNAGKTWTFQDSNSSPVLLVPSIDAGSIAHFDFDFGPEGIPLTQGKNLVISISAANAGGWVSWEAYEKLTVVAAA